MHTFTIILIVYAEIAITDLLLRRCGEEGFTRHLVSTHIIDAHVLHRDYVTRLKPKIRGLTNLQNNNEFMTTTKLEDVLYSWFFFEARIFEVFADLTLYLENLGLFYFQY